MSKNGERRGHPVPLETTQPRVLDVLYQELHRHVGHTLLCVQSTCTIGGYIVETVGLRCEDCSEVLLEGTRQVRKVRAK